MNILGKVYFGNTLQAWLTAAAIFVVLLIVVQIFSMLLKKKLKSWAAKTLSTTDDFIVAILEKGILPIMFVGALYVSLLSVSLPPKLQKVIYAAWVVVLTYFVLKMVSTAFKRYVHKFLQKRGDSEDKEKQAAGLVAIVNVAIWIVGFIFLIDNLGYNVTTLVAGLGIGGIAIALAAQTILGDLFSYFVIFFDRPFTIGDNITVDNKSGEVEYIGIKTTRLRSPDGEELIISNTDLTKSRLHNLRSLAKRLVTVKLRVRFDTAHEKLERIPAMIKQIIEAKDKVAFDRGHLATISDTGVEFEFIYHILTSDYLVHMDVKQAIYLEILSVFEKEGIRFVEIPPVRKAQ